MLTMIGPVAGGMTMKTRSPKWVQGLQGFACIVLAVILAGSSVVTAAPGGPDRACRPRPADLADIAVVAAWVASLQYTDTALPSAGALKAHHTPGYASYYRVNPYRANLGVMGLLGAPVEGKLAVAERWIAWYLRHLNLAGAPPGVVLDHWYTTHGHKLRFCGVRPWLW
jgi:hypothetical protein